ncbi:MAG: S-adenosyl-l-methionine hydroxide adenosyltransferase family protein, partial [Clostridiales Family XIII bacterium]|nr:S-adenosyl-l-methionine hydroxide adenosyltransferase family protein [Clostridiales Family XIII bacterium]
MPQQQSMLVFQSDFGLVDGAVPSMYGVALKVDPSLRLFNLTHDITPYDIWEASYRLFQTIQYWPEGSVFVSVVDPGVGSDRKSVVAHTVPGHYIVTPDNGTLTHVKRYVGIDSVREIDESRYMRPGTDESYTFHGRDLYANTGAMLASGKASYEEIGPPLSAGMVVELPIGTMERSPGSVKGRIDILDVRFGSLWTDITKEDFATLGVNYGDEVDVVIRKDGIQVYSARVRFGKSFAAVPAGELVVYINSLYRVALAINQG